MSKTTTASAIRVWAAANFVDCPAKGPIPLAVRRAYRAAQAQR